MSFFVLAAIFAAVFIYDLKRPFQSSHYIFGIVLGWFLSFFSFILYLTGQNYYFHVLSNLFPINKNIWNAFALANLNQIFMIRIFNFGICILTYCTLLYALTYTKLFSASIKKYHFQQFLLGLMFLEFLLFDPFLYTSGLLNSHTWLTTRQLFSFVNRWATPFFRAVNLSCGIGSLLLLFYQYVSIPKLAYFKKLSFYNFLIISVMEIMNLFLFFWTPMMLIKASKVENYYTHIVPDLTQSLLVVKIVPYISFLLLSLMAYFSYRYTSVTKEKKNIEVSITQNMDTAALGMRIFSHSIKNQLLAIRSETEYLEEITAGNQEAAYSLSLVLNACNNAFECLDIGYDVLRARHIHLKHQSLESTIEKTAKKASQKDPEITILTEYSTPAPYAYIDKEHLTEVLSNILQNAIDAIHGTSDGRKGLVRISVSVQANWLMISIQDNGCGMDAESCKKIFNPFFSTKASVSNWGIGLSFCQRIISAHSGNIIVTSKPNIGTTFEIVLPIAK